MALETFEKLPPAKRDLIVSTGIREFSMHAYNDASTDDITKQCQISKGILYHYFGSKKTFYFYCLEKAMERLTTATEPSSSQNFYEILFDSMNQKIEVSLHYRDEMHMVNMASRDASKDITEGKAEILGRYMKIIQAESMQTLSKAVSALQFKDEFKQQSTIEGLYIYIRAVLNQYLLQYQYTPDLFFENSEQIKAEMKTYLDLMLYGICKQEDL